MGCGSGRGPGLHAQGGGVVISAMTLKDIWRPVETADVDKMEFCQGGDGTRQLFLGALHLAAALAILGLMLAFSMPVLKWCWDLFKRGNYRQAASIYFPAALFA